MNLEQINECFAHRITGGSEFQWKCFGPSARYLDYSSDHASGSVIFDPDTQEVYWAEISENYQKEGSPGPYCWISPNLKQAYIDESQLHGVDYLNAWDDIKYTELETEEDFLTKTFAIFNCLPFDRRISVPLEIDNQTFMLLAQQAHERDITLNQMVEIILREEIEKAKEKSNG